eukprot:496943-Heterocapsa_arctica.AAC.1
MRMPRGGCGRAACQAARGLEVRVMRPGSVRVSLDVGDSELSFPESSVCQMGTRLSPYDSRGQRR